MKHILLLGAVLVPMSAQAADYAVDKAKSHVAFAGEHAGTPFKGEFKSWTADISFDPAALGTSSVKVVFDTASATTGNKMYDGTLPNDDWFDTAKHPQAVFTSKEISAAGEGKYLAKGDLVIRGISKPVELSFTLSDLTKSPVIAKGTLVIDRLAYDIGKKSDSSAEWVSREIPVAFELHASPK